MFLFWQEGIQTAARLIHWSGLLYMGRGLRLLSLESFIHRPQLTHGILDYSVVSASETRLLPPSWLEVAGLSPGIHSGLSHLQGPEPGFLPGKLTYDKGTRSNKLNCFSSCQMLFKDLWIWPSHIFFPLSFSHKHKLTSSSLLATRNIRARISFHRLSVHVEYSVDPHCLSSKAGESALVR